MRVMHPEGASRQHCTLQERVIRSAPNGFDPIEGESNHIFDYTDRNDIRAENSRPFTSHTPASPGVYGSGALGVRTGNPDPGC